jgi:hypothetical protein
MRAARRLAAVTMPVIASPGAILATVQESRKAPPHVPIPALLLGLLVGCVVSDRLARSLQRLTHVPWLPPTAGFFLRLLGLEPPRSGTTMPSASCWPPGPSAKLPDGC